ncbi:MAG TPA: hypothetical protein PLR18_00625 [bacterium]|nr:hypothetical protein [bacterium]
MTREEITEHYTAQNLAAVAKELPKKSAQKMYRTAESIARIIVGEAAFCAACANEPMKKLAIEHLHAAERWADFLAEKAND